MAIDNKTLYLQSELSSLLIESEEGKNPIVTTDEVAVDIQTTNSHRQTCCNKFHIVDY